MKRDKHFKQLIKKIIYKIPGTFNPLVASSNLARPTKFKGVSLG